MDTSEALDLSKENIQPLKQGRNADKLGTALQAQINTEIHQKLLAERERYELLIRMYEGDDPLKPYFDYVRWIEQSFPKHGPESNLQQILENTLTTFREDDRYKQDLRYAELLIKYIDTQPNPIEIYQLVYNQGLCTMCAPFYKAWADELDKNNDLKGADQVYELGIRVKAQPVDLLQEAHLRFQLSVGRRMLGHQEEREESDTDYNRQALHKLQKKNIHSIREPKGAPGQVKQQPLAKLSNKKNAPFSIYQGDDTDANTHSDSHGKAFPKHSTVNKENTLKAGPWTQNGGKHRSQNPMPTNTMPAFQVHEDEDADMGNNYRTPSVPRALKTLKKDHFECPLAVFEPFDKSMKPMYCKNKVYAGATEFQFEELRAAIYNRRYEQLAALKIELEDNDHENSKNVEKECGTPDDKTEVVTNKDQVNVNQILTKQEVPYEHNQQSPIISSQVFDDKTPLESNHSIFHCQSFTVNTKEAMNVVQEMWKSPSPAQAFEKNTRLSRAYPASPVGGLDESGVFKVPALPSRSDAITPVKNKTPKSAVKSTPSFSIYTDDEPAPLPSQPFQVYSEDTESEQQKSKISAANSESAQDSKGCENALSLQLFPPILPPKTKTNRPISDPATLKMLAFQSDSDESGDEQVAHRNPLGNFKTQNPVFAQNMPVASAIEPTPDKQSGTKSPGVGLLPHPAFHEEDRYDDMTCNTKAFDFFLPSSTPMTGHLKSTSNQPVKNKINGSYINDDVKKCTAKQDLSMIFEASKERYSSSSGSSGSKTQGSVCTVANTSVQAPQTELIEKLAQISADQSLGCLEKSIGLLNISSPIDPFSTELINQLLTHLGYPKKHHLIGLHRFETDAPILQCNSNVKLGSTKYCVTGELGKGSYARVLKATREGQPVALKQQRPAWEWEWYIVQELQSRLPPNMMSGFLHMGNGYIYKNASILESEWGQFGSILSVVNKLKIAGKGQDLYLALLFSIQLVSIVENLHKCKIIHGDIKPDNFLLCSIPKIDIEEPCLKLIDFGRSVDMTLFPEGTTFSTVVTTDGFQCNEMKDGRPWTYQTDLYGLAGSIFFVLFYDYMKVVKRDQKWQLTNKVPRYMKPALWQDVFTTLLNVESCETLPDLTALRELLQQHYSSMDRSTINQSLTKLSNILHGK